MRKICITLFITVFILFTALNVSYASSSSGGGSTTPENPSSMGKYTILYGKNYTGRWESLDGESQEIVEKIDNVFRYRNWAKVKEESDGLVNEVDFTTNYEGSDMLFFIGHGFIELDRTAIVVPTSNRDNYYYYQSDFDTFASNSYKNYKWVIFDCCDFLEPSYSDLQYSFTSDNNTVHSLMGFTQELDTDESKKILSHFVNNLFYETVLQAWKHAMLTALPPNRRNIWAIYYVQDTKDETISNPVTNMYFHDVWYMSQTWDINIPYSTNPPDYSVTKDPIEPVKTLPIKPDQNQPLSLSETKNGTKVKKSLINGKIQLNYFRPSTPTVYRVTLSPETSDYQTAEDQFYQSNSTKLPWIHNATKIEHLNQIEYFYGKERVLFYTPTGGVNYRRPTSKTLTPSSTTLTTAGIEKAIQTAQTFINEYGNGLPSSALSEPVSIVTHKNLRTGEVKVESYQISYSRKINGIPVNGEGIEVEVDANGVCYYKRLWRNYRILKDQPENILHSDAALESSAAAIGETTPNPIEITQAELVYVASLIDALSNTLTPAWQYETLTGETFYVNATNGTLIE